MQRSVFFVLCMLAALGLAAPVHAATLDFDQWLRQFKIKARAEGISETTIDTALADVAEDETVVRLDRKQPENKISLRRYLKNTVTPSRIERGREILATDRELLRTISTQYGVQPEYIVALWGIETNYGDNTGNFSVIQSLATLAYEGRRAEFFGKELVSALKILDESSLPAAALTGSWAGAMGNCQFMPSTYLKHAVDGDGDGTRDIWESNADSYASIANYLRSLGWDGTQSWGGKISGPHKLKASEVNINRGRTATYWRKRGLRRAAGNDFSGAGKTMKGNETLYAIYPGKKEEGAYLVTTNYKALLEWNRSRYFATAVGTLADAIGD